MRLSYNDFLFTNVFYFGPHDLLLPIYAVHKATPQCGNEAKHCSTVVTCTSAKDEKLKKWVKAPVRPSTVPLPLCRSPVLD